MSALIVDGSSKETNTRAQLLEIKGVMPNALCYTDIFGLEVCIHMQNRRVLALMHGAIS